MTDGASSSDSLSLHRPGSERDRAGAGEASAPVDRQHLSSWRTLLRSFTELSLGETLARLLGFVALVLMTRRLGPAAFGVVTLGVTLMLWFKIIVDAGTETLNVSVIARSPDRFKEIASAVLGLRLCLSALAIALFLPTAFLFASDSQLVLALFALVFPIVALNLRFMVLGLRAAKGVALGNVAAQFLLAAGVFFLVAGPDETFVVPLLTAASELVYGLVVVMFVSRRFGFPVPRIDVPAWRPTLRGGLPLMISQLASGVVQWVNLFLVAALLGSYWTGVYGAAYKPLLFFATLVALLSGSFLASFSAASPAQAGDLFFRTTRLALVASVVLATTLSVGSSFFLGAAFGAEYTAGATALSILAWFIPMTVVASMYGTVLIATGRPGLLMRHIVAASIVSVGASVVAVSVAGIAGAAAVTVLSHALVGFLNHRSCTRLGLAPSGGAMLRRAISGAPGPSV